MAAGERDRAFGGSVQSEVQEATGAVDPPPPYARPLAFRLVPIADKLRELKSRLGIRPYRVFLCHGRWSGTREGEGAFATTTRREIKPVPKVIDLAALRQNLRATGRTEEGDVRVEEISAALAEDDLMGRTPDLQDPVQPRTDRTNVDFWWEIEEQRPSDPQPVVRCFTPASAPTLVRDGFAWRITLAKRDYDPGRAGGPREIP